MGKRADRATEYFSMGYNCSQAVAMAFADKTGLTVEEIKNASSAFGAGFARTRNICGAVSAIGIVIGLNQNLKEVDSLDPEQDKKDIYKIVRSLTDRFENNNGTIVCGELLKDIKNITKDYVPEKRDEEYYRKRPCTKFVRESALLLEEYFGE